MIKYIFTEEDKKLQNYISEKCKITPITAQILINRGHKDPEEIEKFINISINSLTHPFKMLNLEKAVNKIVDSILNKEKIGIFGDYDVDGITSTAVLITENSFIKSFVKLNLFLPRTISAHNK
jgi:single-stranded-DNA-specific exonuclease